MAKFKLVIIVGSNRRESINRKLAQALAKLGGDAIDWGARPWGQTSWPGKPAAIIGTSGGAISSAIAQQHLRAVLGDLGLHVVGGEAYILFKPDLIDAQGTVTDESVRSFLKNFIDQFAAFSARFAPQRAQRAASYSFPS